VSDGGSEASSAVSDDIGRGRRCSAHLWSSAAHSLSVGPRIIHRTDPTENGRSAAALNAKPLRVGRVTAEMPNALGGSGPDSEDGKRAVKPVVEALSATYERLRTEGMEPQRSVGALSTQKKQVEARTEVLGMTREQEKRPPDSGDSAAVGEERAAELPWREVRGEMGRFPATQRRMAEERVGPYCGCRG